MPLLARLFLALTLLLPLTPAMAQQSQAVHPFAHQGVKEDGGRYEAYLKSNWKLSTRNAAELRRDGERLLRTDPRAASRSFAGAVVADGRDADAWIGLARALLAIAPDPNKDSERYDLPVNASGAAYLGYERAAGRPAEGPRPRRARRRVAAALLLAAGHRRLEDQPCARRQRCRARDVRQAALRARLPHDRLQGRGGNGRPAPVPAVLGSPGARPGRLRQVRLRRRQGSAERIGGERAALHRRPQPRPALPGADPRRPAFRGGRGSDEEHRNRRLRARPQAVRALLRQVLRAAEPWPAGHPAGFDQHRQGRGRGLPHRRPQPRRRARERRFPAPAAELRAGADQVALRREDLHRLHGRAAEAERGNHHGAPRHRRGRHAEARRLRHDRQAVAEVARGLQYRGDAVVHRLRPRPHRLLRR